MAIADSHGTTVTFATSSYSFGLLSVQRSGESVEDIDTTNMSTTTMKSYIAASLKEGGELALGVQYDPTISVTVGGAVQNITIDWAGSGTTESFSGYVKAFDRGAPGVGELMNGTVTVKVAGAAVT